MSGIDRRRNRNHYKKVENQGAIEAGDFREYMNELLDEYGAQIITAVESTAKKVSNEARLDLRNVPKSVVGGYGFYSSGWRSSFKADKLRVTATVYNANEWQLTHLLEYGHQVRRGGRKVGEAEAHPHINEVKDWAFKEFDRRLREEISKL